MKGYVYKLINKFNGKFYIGSTVNIKNRQYGHISNLRCNKHHCAHLQNAFNKYGEDAFYFVFKEYNNLKDEKELRELEERYISYCWSSGKLYNSSKVAGGGDNITTLPKEKYDELIKL
jgi:group I intron endonuclease